MQWSKLKSQVESFFCDSLKGRIELFTTWYKCGGSPERARGVILVDKKEIFEVNTDKWIELHKETSRKELRNQGIYEDLEFRESLKEYLSLSIGEALVSENVLIKALALIDRRVGKRKLLEIEIREDEHQLIKFMYNLRCEADGIINRFNSVKNGRFTMVKEFPYKKFEDTKLWNVVKQAVGDLVENADIEENADRKYIVGYLCKSLFEAGIVHIDTENNSSKSSHMKEQV